MSLSDTPGMRARPVFAAIAMVAVVFAASCKQAKRARYVPGSAPVVLGVQPPQTPAAIAARLDSGKAPSWVQSARWKRVHAIYARYDNAPLWLEPDGIKDRATALMK